MIHLEKKKRNHSGSRSVIFELAKKSKKYRGNEYSVDVRVNHSGEGTKVKTENSCSLNKSRPSRKNSSKQQKKHTYNIQYKVNQTTKIPKYLLLYAGSSQSFHFSR